MAGAKRSRYTVHYDVYLDLDVREMVLAYARTVWPERAGLGDGNLILHAFQMRGRAFVADALDYHEECLEVAAREERDAERGEQGGGRDGD